jgi:hypothetical protein
MIFSLVFLDQERFFVFFYDKLACTIRYTHKTSSYKMSSYKTSFYQTFSYRMSRLQNVQVIKRPIYKTSRLQNVQGTKRPVFVNYKTYLKIFLHKICQKLHTLCGPRGAKLWLNPTLRTRHPCVMGSMSDAVHGCVAILCRDRQNLVP